jgi:transketolase
MVPSTVGGPHGASPSNPSLAAIARRIRARVLRMSHDGGAPHLGSCLSCVDILVAAYFGALRIDVTHPDAAARDRFILSKGHAAAALYATLAARGFFPEHLLDSYNRAGSVLAEQPSPGCVPGLEAATGSLGHGLSLAAGMALAARIQGCESRVVVLLSDGECNEGTVWEAALFATAQHLDHLMAVVDYNGWQATGRSDEIMALAPLAEKWRAFGWSTREVDGHDVEALVRALSRLPNGSGQPAALIAHTIKGKGVSFMEDDNNWHYRVPSDDELKAALEQLREC